MALFQSIKDAFIKNQDKDKYLSGLGRSRKSFGDRIRSLSNSFHGIDDDLLEEIMILLLESYVGIHTEQKIVDRFEEKASHIPEYESMDDLIPYYPYIIIMSFCDNNDSDNSTIVLSAESWVDIEESRYGHWNMHDYYREQLKKELMRYFSN